MTYVVVPWASQSGLAHNGGYIEARDPNQVLNSGASGFTTSSMRLNLKRISKMCSSHPSLWMQTRTALWWSMRSAQLLGRPKDPVCHTRTCPRGQSLTIKQVRALNMCWLGAGRYAAKCDWHLSQQHLSQQNVSGTSVNTGNRWVHVFIHRGLRKSWWVSPRCSLRRHRQRYFPCHPSL